MSGTSPAENPTPPAALALTPTQLAIWRGQQLHPELPLYNMAHSFTLSGSLDVEVFRRAFATLVQGTDALRLVIVENGATPAQQIVPSLQPDLDFHDLAGHPDPAGQLEQWIRQRSRRRFEPGAALFDSALIRLGPERYVWYFCQHHVATDFLSIRLLADRLSRLYTAMIVGDAPPDEPHPGFAAHVEWLARARESKAAARAQAHWDARHGDGDEPLELYGNPLSGKNAHARRLQAQLGTTRSERLGQLAGTADFRGLTPELARLNLLATLLVAYLYRLGNRDRLTLGVPFHNRGSSTLRDTVGPMINILPLRVAVEPGETFRSLHAKLAAENLNALKHAHHGPARPEQHRSVDAVLNYLTGSFGDLAGLPCRFEWHHTGFGDAHHALRLQIHDFAGTGDLGLMFDFNADILHGLEAHRPPEHFLTLADTLFEDPDRAIATVDLLGGAERTRLIAEFNATADAGIPKGTVIERFHARALSAPDDEALRFGARSLSYRDLDRHSDELARELMRSGVGNGATVAILMPRSPELICAMLGVMKAGAVYLPLDPAHPAERLQMIIDDAAPQALLRAGGYSLPDLATACRTLSVNIDGEPTGQASADELPQPHLTDLAYLIYTSGSTGKPKGTLIEHRGLANYLEWAETAYCSETGNVERRPPSFAFFSSAAFDLSVTSIFLPLIAGGTVVIYPETDVRNDLAVLEVFRDDAVDWVKLTPAHAALVRTLDIAPRRIRSLILGGEDLTTELARSLWEKFDGQVRIYNEYGPTETVVGCMLHRYDPDTDTGLSVPIGRPIANMQIHLLDRHGMPVPAGMTGEIFIGGAGVARGYLHRPEETSRAFVSHPRDPALRLYRSGDLGRQDPDGLLTYLGRVDQQVKLRGYRVEPAEIESALRGHPQIRDAVIDLVRQARAGASPALARSDDERRCTRCGLPASYPGAALDTDSVCSICRLYAEHRARIAQYFRSREELIRLAREIKSAGSGQADCIMLLSGGKDSTYALCQLVALGLKPLVFTLDNGYISEQAMANIRKAVDMHGLELVVGTTPYMREIFADSLNRHCNVCNGCFKTLYTLSINLAVERGIGYIFTGLSRGQLFETRLAPELFVGEDFSIERIDDDVDALRRDYHQRRDAVTEHLDVSAFDDPTLFQRVRIIDFYRYWDVELEEILDYLAREVAWLRPEDTGRSSNCLINDAGISVHTRRRGYHNYALPYSWDVRLGHKTREEAIAELEDRIDPAKVSRILGEIGYELPEDGTSDTQLVAYIEASQDIPQESLRAHLEQRLPAYMLPARYVRMPSLPLTAAGKIDRKALARLAPGDQDAADYTAPRNDLEAALAKLWQEILGIPRIGVEDNFFDLGGTSLPALQIVARVKDLFHIDLPLRALFSAPTVAGLAENVEAELLTQLESMSDEQAERLLEDH